MKKLLRTGILIVIMCTLLCSVAAPAAALEKSLIKVTGFNGGTLKMLDASNNEVTEGTGDVVKFSLEVTGLAPGEMYFLIMLPAEFTDGAPSVADGSIPSFASSDVLFAYQYTTTGEKGGTAGTGVLKADGSDNGNNFYIYPKQIKDSVILISGGGTVKRVAAVESLVEGAKLTGTISNYSKAGAPSISLYAASDTEYETPLYDGTVTTVNASGSGTFGNATFEIKDVPQGEYVIRASKEYNVSLSVSVNVTEADELETKELAVGNVLMYCGDANKNGVIEGSDLSFITVHYNKDVSDAVAIEPASAGADFDDSGVLDGADLSFITTGYNQPTDN